MISIHPFYRIFLKLETDLWNDQKPETWNPRPERSRRVKLRTSPHNIQPPRTIIIDIRGAEDEILSKMIQKTRYNIRLAEKKGVIVRAWDDIESFHKMMLVTGGRDGFGIHSLEYYKRAYELLHPKGLGELFVAEYEGKPLAALFVARNGHRAYYLYGASTDEERNRMPTYLLQWEAMKWAKARLVVKEGQSASPQPAGAGRILSARNTLLGPTELHTVVRDGSDERVVTRLHLIAATRRAAPSLSIISKATGPIETGSRVANEVDHLLQCDGPCPPDLSVQD